MKKITFRPFGFQFRSPADMDCGERGEPLATLEEALVGARNVIASNRAGPIAKVSVNSDGTYSVSAFPRTSAAEKALGGFLSQGTLEEAKLRVGELVKEN